MSQKLLFDNPPATQDERGRCYCPACGYSPVIEAVEHNREAEAKGLPEHVMTDVPSTWEQSLDFFEVGGADEGNVFCPVCLSEFNPMTGVVAVCDLDDDDE